jgi:hypothetical protein
MAIFSHFLRQCQCTLARKMMDEVKNLACATSLSIQHVSRQLESRSHRFSQCSVILIQVDIGGHPHFPNGSKQFSGHFGNLLFLAGFHFRGHFEGLNEVFSRSRFSMIAKGMIEPPK